MSHSRSFDVVPFSEEAFFAALRNGQAAKSAVHRNPRVQYLVEYLTKLGAWTIVIEYEYTDGDYLEDFVAYYSRCFAPYGRRCTRLHFFSRSFTTRGFRSAVKGDPTAERRLQDSYLGFVVARPLPEAQIGRTILQTYPQKSGREYTCKQTYAVSLFGI